MAETTELDLAVSKIAQVLDVREGNGRYLIDTLKDFLGNKTLLLVLDNLEQLAGAASLATDLLEAAPKLKLLISSRIVLRMRGEHEFPVAPLEVPDPFNLPALEQLRQNESIQLFIQRAEAANPKFALTQENAPAVAAICQGLEGLPLAIELAAARIKILPPQAMLAKLGNKLSFLTGGGRDLPARQQTLRNTLDWSHSLLSAREKALFARLGYFAGSFSLEAAESICNQDGKLDVLGGVEILLNNSLLRQQEDPNGGARFRMLGTVRGMPRRNWRSGPSWKPCNAFMGSITSPKWLVKSDPNFSQPIWCCGWIGVKPSMTISAPLWPGRRTARKLTNSKQS